MFNGAVYVADHQRYRIQCRFLADNLTAMMMCVVTLSPDGARLHHYYMHEDPGYQRFFSYIFAVYLLDADAGDVE